MNNMSTKLQVEHPQIVLRSGESTIFNKKYCINNQLPRFTANIIVLVGIIYSGTYLDINYLSYCIKNDFDRQYNSVYMLVLFVYVTLVYLKCSYTKSAQTRIESLQINRDDNNVMSKPLINIKNHKFNSYCEFCKGKKFERSSHCRSCGFCVLRRDHHCPGLGICVGYHNTQLFCNLVFVMTVS